MEKIITRWRLSLVALFLFYVDLLVRVHIHIGSFEVVYALNFNRDTSCSIKLYSIVDMFVA